MLKFSKSHQISILISNLSKMFSTYRNYFIVCSVVLILIVVSLTFLHHRSVAKEATALEVLSDLEELYLISTYNSDLHHETTYDEIKDKFMTVIEDLGAANKTSNITKIILANISYNAGALQDAIIFYSDALQKLDDTMVLKNLVLAKLAYCHLANDALDEAEVYFEQILSSDRSTMKDEALFNIALLHESNGKLALAEKLYNQFLIYFPDSPYSKIIKQKVE